MSVEKFEVGKKYRFLKDGNGDRYCGCDVKAGQVFTVHTVGDWITTTKDVTFEGSSGIWDIWFDGCGHTLLEDFELVEESIPAQIIPDNNVDALETHSDLVEEQTDVIAPSVGENVTEGVTSCPIEQIKQLCSDHDVNIEISNKGEIYIHIENIDNTYKVSDMKQLTQVLDSVKLLESFKER